MATPAVRRASPANGSGNPGQDRSITVLFVEDVVLVRMLVADALRQRDFHIIEARSGEEAIKVLQSGLSVDVVLSDVFMPGAEVDGRGLLDWIRRNCPSLRVILCSGVTTNIDLGAATADVGPVLSKPFRYDELERRLREAIQGPRSRPTTT